MPDGEAVIVRCGDQIVVLDRLTGALRSCHPFAKRAGDGTFAIRHADVILTDLQRRPARLTTLVAVEEDGSRRWTTDLDAIALRSGARRIGGALYVLTAGASASVVLFRIDVHSGEVLDGIPLRPGGQGLAPWRGGFLLRNQTAGASGLVKLNDDFGAPEPLEAEPVWAMHADPTGDVVYAASPVGASVGKVAVLDGEGGQRWSVPTKARTVAMGAGSVLHVDADTGDAVVCRDLRSGDVRWTQRLEVGAIDRLDGRGHWWTARGLGKAALLGEGGAVLTQIEGNFGPPVEADGHLLWVGGQAVWAYALP